jgi:hypothetical protein
MPRPSFEREGIKAEIDRVRSLGVDSLRTLWRTTFRSSPPPAFSKDILARFLCWHIQEQAFGGLDPSVFSATFVSNFMDRTRIVTIPYAKTYMGATSHSKWPRSPQMAEVAIPRNLFVDILRLVLELRQPPAAHRREALACIASDQDQGRGASG